MIAGTSDLRVDLGETMALNAVTMGARGGEITAVIGGDGAGKSTLLRVLAGLIEPAAGTVRRPPRGRIGYVPGSGGVFGDLSVAENLAFVAGAFSLGSWKADADEMVGRIGLAGAEDRLARELSGGQRRKLATVMAALPRPELLLLDEVTTGVDPVSRVEMWRLMAGAAADGSAVVFATTYLDEAERAHRVVLLHEGRLLVSGSPADLLRSGPASGATLEEAVVAAELAAGGLAGEPR